MSNEVRRPQDLADRIAERRDRQRWLTMFDRQSAVLPVECLPPEHPTSVETTRTETTVDASGFSDQQLAQLIDTSVSEVALMWILHQQVLSLEMRNRSLDRQISNFSDAAFRSIKSSLHHLRDVEEAHLWLVYFKGLITANTHPREQMVRAINVVRERSLDQHLTVVPENEPRSSDDLSDAETLAQIADALEATKNEAGIS